MDVNLLPIVYWKDMFEERGLEVPTTIDEAVAISDEFNAEGIKPIVSMFGEAWPQVDIFVYFVRAADASGTLMDKAMVGEASWEDPLFKEALQAFVTLQTEKVFPNNIMEMVWGDSLDMFNKKEAAMVYPVGQFGLNSFPKEAIDNDELGTMPFLKLHAEDKEMITGGASAMTCVNIDSPNVDAAVTFLKFINGPVGQEAEFDILRTPPGSLVDKKSDVNLFNIQTDMQNNMEVGYRRINSAELYAGVQDVIARALLGDNIDELLAELEAISQEVNK
jgi:raffinose/stachyose/melibiose transport system substrate-binding protein